MAQPSAPHARTRTNSSRASDSSRNDDSGPGGEGNHSVLDKKTVAYRMAIQTDILGRRRLHKTIPSTGPATSQGQRAPSIPRSVTDPRLQAIGGRRQSIRGQDTIAPRG